MNFVNNWMRPIALGQGVTVAELDLPDGTYRLTLSDDAATRWEIVTAEVASGSAALQRGQEGTDDQLWPVGSVVYCSVTAALLQQIMQAIESGGAEGPPGPPLEMQATATHIQWRVVGDEAWIDLVALSAITPSTESVAAAVIEQIGARLLPAGGDAEQSLVKTSGDDFAVGWADRLAPPPPADPAQLFAVYADDYPGQGTSVMQAGLIDTETGNVTALTWADDIPGQIGCSVAAGIVGMSPPFGSNAITYSGAGFSTIVTEAELAGSGRVAVSPDGQWFVSVYNGGASIATAPDFSDIDHTITVGSNYRGAAFTPDSSQLFMTRSNGVEVYDVASWSLVSGAGYSGGNCRFPAFSGSGERLLLEESGSWKVFEVDGWSVVATLGEFVEPMDAYEEHRGAWHPLNENLLAIAGANNEGTGETRCAAVFDLSDAANPVYLSPGDDVSDSAIDAGYQVQWSADGARLYLACNKGLYEYDASDWSFIREISSGIDRATFVVL